MAINRIILSLLLTFFIFDNLDIINGSTESIASKANSSENSYSKFFEDFSPIITLVIGTVSGIFLNHFVSPKIKEKYLLREKYLVPFKEWCNELYGELTEFESMILKEIDENKDSNVKRISNLQIILDYWSLHHAFIGGEKYFYKISVKSKKDNVYGKLRELVNEIEIFWHNLEDKYSLQIASVSTAKEFNAALKKVEKEKRDLIAQEIVQHIKEKNHVYKSIHDIKKYLKKEIPK